MEPSKNRLSEFRLRCYPSLKVGCHQVKQRSHIDNPKEPWPRDDQKTKKTKKKTFLRLFDDFTDAEPQWFPMGNGQITFHKQPEPDGQNYRLDKQCASLTYIQGILVSAREI